MITQHCLKHMDIERWVLKQIKRAPITLLVVVDATAAPDTEKSQAADRLLNNMLIIFGLRSEQISICNPDMFESVLMRCTPRFILGLGAESAGLLKKDHPIPLVLSYGLSEILSKPLLKKNVQNDLALIQTWLNN